MRFVLLSMALFLCSCGSPRNHRVLPDNELVQKQKGEGTFSKTNIKVRAEWLHGPFGNVKSASTLIVYLYDANGRLSSLPANSEISFFATMPSMGHALDQPGYFKNISQGIYLNNEITFNMPGEWQMELWIHSGDGELQDQVVWQDTF